MVSRFQGSGRNKEGGYLATHKQDFNAHYTGGDFRHGADDIDMNPALSGFSATNVQTTLEEFISFVTSSGSGFVSVGSITGTAGKYNVGDPATPTFESALSAAFTDSRLTNGGIVLIMAGTYVMNTSVSVPVGITIMGELAGTIIVGEMTEQPMFLIPQSTDTTTIGADTGGGEEPLAAGAPADAVKFFNLTLADNVNGNVKSSGLPISTMQTVPMISCEKSSNLICEEVRFVGRVNYGGPAARGKTLRAIGGYSSGGTTQTGLTIKRCYFDGMATTIDFSPGGGDIDHLVVEKCRARIFGTEDSASTDPENNCFVSFTQCNATLVNNYCVSENNGGLSVDNTARYLFVMQDSAGTSNIHVVIVGNSGYSAIGTENVLTYSAISPPTTTEVPLISGNTWETIPFTIEEDATFGKVWRNVDHTITLQDKIMSDAGVDPHDLTSTTLGADRLRVIENDPTLDAVNFPTPPSIFQMINGKWTCTVGDGTDTFGDFNGDDAIHQAIAYFVAHVAPLYANVSYGLHIQCKPGRYLVNATNGPITVPDACDLTIEGPTGLKYQSWRQVEIVSDQTEAINFVSSALSALRLLNLTIRSSALTDIATNESVQYIEAENCEFSRTRLNLYDAHSCIIKKCEFRQNSFSANGELILLEMGDGGQHAIFKFVDCYFQTSRDCPVIRIKASGSTIIRTTIPHIEFHRCRMFLSTTSASSGNLLGNSGVVDTDPNGSSWYNPGEGLEVEKLLFKDCNVEMSAASYGSQTLIHLIPTSNGASISALTDEFVMYYDVEISGGSWISSNDNSTFSPFVIAGVKNLTIRDCVLGFWLDSTPLYGGPTADLDYWFTGVFGGSLPTTAEWGAFATSAEENTVWKNVRFQNLVQLSDTGDLFIRYNQLTMENIYMNDYVAGGTGSVFGPSQRVRFRPYAEEEDLNAHVKNLVVTAKDVEAVASDWGYDSVIYYEPSIAHFVFDGCRVGRFDISGSSFTTMDGIEVPSVAVGAYYTGSGNDTRNLTITNCKFENLRMGVRASSSSVAGVFREMKIIGNYFVNNDLYGIMVTQSGVVGGAFRVTISDNIIHDSGSFGAIVSAECWSWAGIECYVIMTDNHIFDNNGTPGAIQVRIRANFVGTAQYQEPAGVFSDNNLTSQIGSTGILQTNHTNNVAEIALPSPDSFINVPLRGIETGHDITNTIRYYFANTYMVRNVAILNSP